MKEDMQTTEGTALSRQEGKKKAKGSPTKRRLIPAANYKQSVRDTFTDKDCIAGDLYTMAEICHLSNGEERLVRHIPTEVSLTC